MYKNFIVYRGIEVPPGSDLRQMSHPPLRKAVDEMKFSRQKQKVKQLFFYFKLKSHKYHYILLILK